MVLCFRCNSVFVGSAIALRHKGPTQRSPLWARAAANIKIETAGLPIWQPEYGSFRRLFRNKSDRDRLNTASIEAVCELITALHYPHSLRSWVSANLCEFEVMDPQKHPSINVIIALYYQTVYRLSLATLYTAAQRGLETAISRQHPNCSHTEAG